MEKHIKSHNSKNGNKAKFNRKTIIFLLILVVLITIITIFIKSNQMPYKDSDTQIAEEKQIEENSTTESINMADIPNTMGGYNVLGTIVIDKLGLTKNILDETTDEALNLSVTKFYGPDINEQGNFCITGHNYKEIFAYLNDLELNDTFYIIDKKHSRKITYQIYDKYTVNPTELECIDQETDGKKEVTLITCNPGGITRLIIKSREI